MNNKNKNHKIDPIVELQSIIDDLLKKTNASRTTLRIDIPKHNLNVRAAAVEALAPGVQAIKDDSSLDQRKAITAQYIEKHRRVLVQDNFEDLEVRPPIELIKAYSVKAQMLGPIEWGKDLIGWISVHYTLSERQWSQEDIFAIETAMKQTLLCLQESGWLDKVSE